jgi:hypothetical protein
MPEAIWDRSVGQKRWPWLKSCPGLLRPAQALCCATFVPDANECGPKIKVADDAAVLIGNVRRAMIASSARIGRDAYSQSGAAIAWLATADRSISPA